MYRHHGSRRLGIALFSGALMVAIATKDPDPIRVHLPTATPAQEAFFGPNGEFFRAFKAAGLRALVRESMVATAGAEIEAVERRAVVFEDRVEPAPEE